jgi:large subunit ribosomal protein L25
MQHAEVEFPVTIKTGHGKGAARKVRAAGAVPGILYGFQTEPTMVTFEERALVKALSTSAGKNVFLRIKSENATLNGIRVLIKDLQVHPLLRKFVHADFYKLDPEHEMHATVPVRLTGTAAGAKLGGILQSAMRDIRVICKPDDLPEAIVVDVTELNLGHSIHVGDITPPAGVRFLVGPEQAVCAVVSPSAVLEDAAAAAAAAAAEKGVEPEEETKG